MKVILGELPKNELLFNFLSKCSIKKYSGWPNADRENVLNFLLNNIVNNANPNNTIFVVNDNEILSLLTYDYLEWDTNHFGLRTANISHLMVNSLISTNDQINALETIIESFIKECAKSDYNFASVDIGSWDFAVADVLQKFGFRYTITQIDGFVNQKYELDNNKDVDFGEVKKEEIEKFAQISSTYYFTGGRFYADYRFNISKVDQMYANLVKSSYQSGQIMLSYRLKGKPVGLFICKKIVTIKEFQGLRVAPLRFLVVDPSFRGRSIALDLFKRTVNYLLDRCDIVTTGLENHNIPSLNLHVKLDFQFNYTHNVFHWWEKKDND
jgi:GNAT superfamily N-acetyltransferase